MNSRLFISLVIIAMSFTGSAQVQFAYYVGAQRTSALYKVQEIKQPTEYKSGYMGGVAVKVEFDNQLYFFPTVFYSLKGYKVKLNMPSFPPSEYAINNDVAVHSIEFAPLFHIDFNRKLSHLFVRFGPSMDAIFKGNEKFDTMGSTGDAETIERPMRFAFSEYGRFTTQANLHFGYENFSPRDWNFSRVVVWTQSIGDGYKAN